MTTHMATNLRAPLEAVVGPGHVRDDPGALLTYSTDATPLERGRPDIIVFPGSTDEVAGVLRFAERARRPGRPARVGDEPQRGHRAATAAGSCSPSPA